MVLCIWHLWDNIFGGSEQHSLEWPGACDSMHSTQYLTSHWSSQNNKQRRWNEERIVPLDDRIRFLWCPLFSTRTFKHLGMVSIVGIWYVQVLFVTINPSSFVRYSSCIKYPIPCTYAPSICKNIEYLQILNFHSLYIKAVWDLNFMSSDLRKTTSKRRTIFQTMNLSQVGSRI